MAQATVRDYFANQVQEKLSEASKIAAAGQEAGGLSDEQKTVVKQLLDEAEGLNAKIKDIDDADAMAAQIAAFTGPKIVETEEVKGARSIGDAFVKSAGYQTIKTPGSRTNTWTSGVIEYDGPEFSGKAEATTVASPIVPVDYTAGINPILSQQPTVASLFGQATTTGNTINYVVETTATNAAAGTSQGATKPESALVFANRTTTVRKIATFLPVSDEMLEDVSQIQSYLDSRLSLFVRQAEDVALLSGDGVDPNLLGVLNTGIHTANATALIADNAPDALYQAITTIRDLSFLEPDAIVMHPTNWAAIRLSKDQNDQYYGGGPFTGAYGNAGGMAPNNIWGLPVVVTSAITLDTALVGAFRTAATLFRRTGLTVEASNSHQDFFRRNMTAIRAETRLALAVIRPAGFFKITNLDDVFS